MNQIVEGGGGGEASQILVVVERHEYHGQVLEKAHHLSHVPVVSPHLGVQDVPELHVASLQKLVHPLPSPEQLDLLRVFDDVVDLFESGNTDGGILVQDLGEHHVQGLVGLHVVCQLHLLLLRVVVVVVLIVGKGRRRRELPMVRKTLVATTA